MGKEEVLFIISTLTLGISGVLWYWYKSAYLLLLLFSLLGFLLHLPSPRSHPFPVTPSFLSPPPQKRERVKEFKSPEKESQKESILPKEEFLGSTATRKYHQENCPDAKKIPHKKRVQFDSRLAAVEESYAAHSCVK